MKRVKVIVFALAVVTLSCDAWGQSRNGSSIRSAAGSASQSSIVKVGHYRQTGCSACDGPVEHHPAIASRCDSCGGCGCCDVCRPCLPRILPAIACGIHTVADRVTNSLSCLFPCHYRRWSCGNDLWDGCCSQSCGRSLWAPGCGECGGGIDEGYDVMEEQHVPTPKAERSESTTAIRRSKVPASLPSSNYRIRTSDPRAVKTASVSKKKPAASSPLKLEYDDTNETDSDTELPAKSAPKTIRRTSGESPTVKLAPVNPLR